MQITFFWMSDEQEYSRQDERVSKPRRHCDRLHANTWIVHNINFFAHTILITTTFKWKTIRCKHRWISVKNKRFLLSSDNARTLRPAIHKLIRSGVSGTAPRERHLDVMRFGFRVVEESSKCFFFLKTAHNRIRFAVLINDRFWSGNASQFGQWIWKQKMR